MKGFLVWRMLLLYAEEGGSVHTVKENAEALVVATKEIGLEVNADKSKYVSCLEIRMRDEITIYGLIIASLKGWKSSNIWEQP
jgi:hypothetical protein